MTNNRRTCEVASHFNDSPHSLTDFSFICIESVLNTQHTDDILTHREAYWTAQLFTLHPHGLNKRREYKSKNRIQYQ